MPIKALAWPLITLTAIWFFCAHTKFKYKQVLAKWFIRACTLCFDVRAYNFFFLGGGRGGGGGVVILSTPVQYLCMCLWQLPSKWRTSSVALNGPFHTLHARSVSLAFSPSFFDALNTMLILLFKCYVFVPNSVLVKLVDLDTQLHIGLNVHHLFTKFPRPQNFA